MDKIAIPLTLDERKMVIGYVDKVKTSTVSYCKKNRTPKESRDNHFCGKCGELALYKENNRIDDFTKISENQVKRFNLTGKYGDGGVDIGKNIDIKTAKHFYPTLFVPFEEFDINTIYLRLFFENDSSICYIAGWIEGKYMVKGLDYYGEERMTFPMKDLKPYHNLFIEKE